MDFQNYICTDIFNKITSTCHCVGIHTAANRESIGGEKSNQQKQIK